MTTTWKRPYADLMYGITTPEVTGEMTVTAESVEAATGLLSLS